MSTVRRIDRGVWFAAILLFNFQRVSVLAADLDLAIQADSLDRAATQMWHNGKALVIDPDQLDSVLGISKVAPNYHGWSAGSVAKEGDSTEFVYRVAFNKPTPIGSIFLSGSPRDVYVLNPDIEGPGDPGNERQWTKLTLRPRQSMGVMYDLPEIASTRAILLKDPKKAGHSVVHVLRLFAVRLRNVAPLGFAYANQEYTPINTKNTYAASHLTSGKGMWQSAGADSKGFIASPPLTDINPGTFLLAWEHPQVISGIWIRDNFTHYELQRFAGDEAVHPRAGTAQEWKKVTKFSEQLNGGRWLKFDPPLKTHGLRWIITKTERPTNIPYGSGGGPQVAEIAGLHVFAEAATVVNDTTGTKPGTAVAGQSQPPKRIALEVPASAEQQPRQLTVVIEGPDGRRVRNLISREEASAGQHQYGWDLHDDQGVLIAPGKYRWKALTHEPFRLKYETTVYPNVRMHAPENSPWMNGLSDSGGWLADHTPPVGCCTANDRVYLSAYVAESGVSLIECDLQGRKQWGHHSFAAWTGPRYLASDNKSVFVGAQVLGSTTDALWTVDIKTKEVKTFLSLVPTASRKRGMEGIAAKPGELAISVQAKENWLANAAAAEDADPDRSLPLHGAKRKPRVAYELVPDPRGDFLRLFRLIPHPPGGETQATSNYLYSQRGKGSRNHVVLAFNKPIALGSVVFPVPLKEEYQVRLSVLKPKAAYPPVAEKEADWQPFEVNGTQLWDAIPAPPDTMTRALRITFAKGASAGNDAVAKLLEGDLGDDPLGDSTKSTFDEKNTLADAARKQAGLVDEKSGWVGRLEGMKLLRRRYANSSPQARVTVNSGEVNAEGEWDAQRDRPLTEADPGIYTMEWDKPVTLRGLAIKEIDGQFTKIDVLDPEFIKPNSATEDASKSETKAGWQEVATYEQQRRDVANGYGGIGIINPTSRYVDGYVDFGREIKTRSVRLRVVAQWKDNGQSACLGVRIDRGGGQLDAKRCRVYGVAALTYIGGESAIDAAVNDRIEVYSTNEAKLLREVPLEQPKEIAYAPNGQLWAISGTRVVPVPADTADKASAAVLAAISDLKAPTDLAFDRHGHIYVFDGDPERHHIRVYQTDGKLLRTIGTPGGLKAGAWDPTRMGEVTAISIDEKDQLWVVENQYWPKRVTVWSTAGEFQKELLGNTAYGGGGVLDPEDKTRLFYGPLEFAIDWKTGESRLKNLTTLDGFNAGEIPIRANGRQYLVTRPLFADRPVGIVYAYENNQARLAAALGLAVDFDPLKKPEILAALGSPDLKTKCFIWTDRNGDREVQAVEVSLFDRPAHVAHVSNFNRDLSIQQQRLRYTVKEFLPDGTPVYVVDDMLPPTSDKNATPSPKQKDGGFASRTLYRLDDGNFFRLSDEPNVTQAVLRTNGQTIWNYITEGGGVQALTSCGPYHPGQVASEFGIVGHETAHAGDLGEFLVTHANHGAWSVWTADGILVGPIFKDLRTSSRAWSMKEHSRGMTLADITAGQEHFAGYFCRTHDNKYYVVAGHNHASILEVVGLETAQRQSGELEITSADLLENQQWESQQQQREVFARAPVIDCYRVSEAPRIDGKLTDWKAADAHMGVDADFYIGYDDEWLYVGYQVRGLGPLKNSGRELDRLFKTGAAVDLQFGTDADADETRQAPVAGDKRLLMTMAALKGVDNTPKPVAVLFDAVVPGTPAAEVVRIVSPVAEETFDRIVRVEGIKFAAVPNGDQAYTVEAAIPLKSLGLQPEPGQRLKLDWGVLSTDQDGNVVLRRRYWSNQATSVVADAPSEARLTPKLWGHVRFQGVRASTEDRFDDFDAEGKRKKPVSNVSDLLDDLNNADPKPTKKKSKDNPLD